MKRGFTLIELLVYMAIMGFIIVVAGRAYSDATSMRVRTQSMTKATEEANRIAEIIKEDLSQMGAKAGISLNAQGDYVPEAEVKQAYMKATLTGGDSSSFELRHRTDLLGGNDSIAFKKISYDQDGKYIGTRLIDWVLASDSVLRRRCVTIHPSSPSSSDPEIGTCPHANDLNGAVPVIMAENVRRFTLYPSKPSEDPLGKGANFSSFGGEPTAINPSPTFGLVSRTGADIRAPQIDQPSVQNNTATLNGFAKNATNPNERLQSQVFVVDKNANVSDIDACESFSFKKNETYAIKFKTPISIVNNIPDSLMALFQPGKDHMAVGFRSSNGAAIPGMLTDFMFYPPQENKANSINQYFEFSVPEDVSNACVAFTFAFYSGRNNFGPHMGTLKIKDFELLHKKDGTHKFEQSDLYATVTDTDYEHKRNVKAFELILEINKRNEIGSTRKQTDNGVIGYVIPVPNNGITPPEP